MNAPIGYQCSVFDKIHYPSHARCLQCKNKKFIEVDLPSSGNLITYSVVYTPSSEFQSPLCLGIIELSIDLQKIRYTGQLDIKHEHLRVGMRVCSKRGIIKRENNQDIYGYLWIQCE